MYAYRTSDREFVTIACLMGFPPQLYDLLEEIVELPGGCRVYTPLGTLEWSDGVLTVDTPSDGVVSWLDRKLERLAS